MQMRSSSTPAARDTLESRDRHTADHALQVTSAHPIFVVLLLAAAVRVFIALVLTEYFSGTLVLDDTTYHFMAREMAEGLAVAWDDFTYGLYWGTATFTVPVTVLYKVFGPSPLAGQFFAALMGTFAAVFVTRLGLEFLAPRRAVFAGLIVALLPSQAFWSSMLMKDSSVWFVLTGLGATAAVASRATGKRLATLGVAAGGLLFLLSYLRLHTLVVAVWALMISSFFGSKQDRIARIAGALVLGISVPWVFGAIGPAGLSLLTNAGSLEERRFENARGANTAIVPTGPKAAEGDGVPIGEIEKRVTELERQIAELEQQATELEESRSGLAVEMRARILELRAQADAAESKLDGLEQPGSGLAPGPSGADEATLDPNLRHLPRGLSVMLLEPFPLPFEGSVSLKLARLESLLWYPLLMLAVVGLWNVRSHLRQMIFSLLVGSGIVVMYALSEGNLGTAHRHRGEFVWVVALLAAIGVSALLGRRSETASHAVSTRPDSQPAPSAQLLG